MEAVLLHHLGVPCKAAVREPDNTLMARDMEYFLNPEAIVRYEPGGAVIISPTLYSSFLYADQSLADLFRQRIVPVRGLPRSTVDLLLENQVLLTAKPVQASYREFEVGCALLPPQCLLDFTSGCQCDCVTCYHHDDLDGYEPPLIMVLSRISKLKELGVCLIEDTGGEPFTRKDLEAILWHMIQLKLHFYVVTNGEYLYGLSEEMIFLLKQGLGLAVSLDGVGEVHDRVRRRPGLYAKLIRGLDYVCSRGVKVYLISTVNELNVGCVPEMVRVAERFNTTVHLRPTIRTGAAEVNELGHFYLVGGLQEFLNHPNVRNGLLATKKTIPQAKFYGCGIRKRISVSSRGILFPCVMCRPRSLLPIESYSQESLVRELDAETRYFLDRHRGCRNCQVNVDKDGLICGGFCRFSGSHIRGVSP